MNKLFIAITFISILQDVQEKARQESIKVLGTKLVDVSPTLKDSKKFPYLDMVIKEVLRMHAPFNEISVRVSDEDVELGGVVIPKHTIVNVDIEALHYNPDIWKNPEQFDPERFAEGSEHYSHEGITWAPFSGGSRQCIGINFSMMEQRIALSMLCRFYSFFNCFSTINIDLFTLCFINMAKVYCNFIL